MSHHDDNYNRLANNWLSEFKSKLKSDIYGNFKLYILNKDFLRFPEKRGNLNKNILIENIIDYKDASFTIINEVIWNKIKSKYPNEKSLVCNGTLLYDKFLFEIKRENKNHIYYFYYINYLISY